MSFDYKATGKAFDFDALKKVLKLLSGHRKIFYLSILLSFVASVVTPAVPYVISGAMDVMVKKPDVTQLSKFSFVVAILLLMQAILSYIVVYQTSWLGQQAIYILRNKVFNHILNFRLRVYDKTPVGTMITRTISDIEAVADIFSEGLIQIIGDVLQVVILLLLMFYTDWRLSLISLAVFPLLLLSAFIFKEKVKKAFQEVRTQVARLNTFLQEHITGLQVVQVFNRQQQEMESFKDINKLHRDANIKSVLYYSVFFPVIELLSAIAIALVVWYGSTHIAKENSLTLGTVVSFIMYLGLLFRPVRQIADKFNTLQMGMVASERIFKVLEMEDETSKEGKVKTPIKGKVIFSDVSFSYDGQKEVLNNISVTAEEGKMLAIVGHTGSGKSSLISLINRLYPYQNGEIFIDDIRIENYDYTFLRRQIAVVLQDVFLFSDSLKNNISLYNENISLSQIQQAATDLGLQDFIMDLPGGYEYHVQERGGTLSSGQRQLISFIRAMVHQPKILILDEATSSVDPHTEELLQKATNRILKNRTSIVIAHRLSTITAADKIIVLSNGRITAEGSHKELLDSSEYYRQLNEQQFSELTF